MKKVLTIALILCASWSYSQQLSNISIGSITSNMQAGDVSLSFSVGDLVVDQFETGSIILGTGFYPIINVITSTDSPENSIDLIAYPNPVNDVLNLKLNGSNGYSYQVEILNLNGQVHASLVIHEDTSLSLIDLPDGMYLLKIQTFYGKKLYTQKFIKSK